jgi:SAM-dependent methyltransferase
MTRKPFVFRGTTFEHFDHDYNRASHNMRSVEVPLIRRYLADKRRRILEIGNVLSHYQETTWTVVDIREKGPRVRNVDVMKFEPEKPFDLIISISTLEHIGHGKYAQHTNAVPFKAIVDHIRSMLAPDGTFVATVPLSYNERLDEAIRNDATGADCVWYMRQANKQNEWEQCTKEEALAAPYGHWSTGMALLQCGWFPWDMLNLGAGHKIIPYAVNHDLYKHRPEIDVAWDLNDLPWLWEDESFDKIIASSVLEHSHHNLTVTLDECWRILRPQGVIYLKLPYWAAEISHDDATHYWPGFGLGVLDQFDPDTRRGRMYSFYPMKKWEILRRPQLNSAKTSFSALMRVRK